MVTKPLKGLRILNTRPHGQNEALNQLILEAGGHPFICPAIEILHSNEDTWLPKLPPLDQVQQAIFISHNAVQTSFAVFVEKNIIWPHSIQVTAIGCATAKTLASYGVSEVHIPNPSHSEALLKLDFLQVIYNQTILLFKGDGGRTLITDTLGKRGARLIELPVYQRIIPTIAKDLLIQWQETDAIDIILYTSEEAMRNIFTLFGNAARAWLQSKPALVISDRLADCARQLGIVNIILSSPNDLLKGLKIYNKGRTHG